MGSISSKPEEDDDSEDEDIAQIMDLLQSNLGSGVRAVAIPKRRRSLDSTDITPTTACLLCTQLRAEHIFVPCGCRIACNGCAVILPKLCPSLECPSCGKEIKEVV